jgi:ketosteroid isomerase-like protein
MHCQDDEENTMKGNSVENEVFNLETQYWQAIKTRDIDMMDRLTDDPCFVAGPMGVHQIDKSHFRKIMQSPTHTLHSFDLKNPAVRLLRDDIAIVAYQVHEEVTVGGKRFTLEASDTSTWIKRNGQWVCALHSECLAGDPYGRDRKAA